IGAALLGFHARSTLRVGENCASAVWCWVQSIFLAALGPLYITRLISRNRFRAAWSPLPACRDNTVRLASFASLSRSLARFTSIFTRWIRCSLGILLSSNWNAFHIGEAANKGIRITR